MNKTHLTIALTISLIVNILLIFALTIGPTPTVPEERADETPDTPEEKPFSSGDTYPFIRVVDGDTVIVGVEGRSEYVRLIGIDSPEPNDPDGPECYATEATEHMKELARTGTVLLRFESAQGYRDTYGRLLAYVELADGTDLGEKMLRDGYAREFTYGQGHARRDSYIAAEESARSNATGLWSPETCPVKE
ncbi:MAG: thermonuclease family protein [Candidatus Pacebacteria bacterium]|nr:thermonuclease family protein [Candidatus Paceibacterota bacterium]